jgi:recombination DNA repair RAD52 pathway protein
VNPEIVTELLRPIDPSRVGKDGKGFSHVEAWDIRRTMNAIFGFGEWSADVTDMQLIYEEAKEVTGKTRWSVAYRARCSVTVWGAVYAEWAAGDATNYPSRADAHDQALKTAESQAFKRCCVNLGDQFGLSLYNGGSMTASVQEVVGREHADDGKAEEWRGLLNAVKTRDDLNAVVSKMRGADLSAAVREDLVDCYRAAENSLTA